jgi:hypothetical protein
MKLTESPLPADDQRSLTAIGIVGLQFPTGEVSLA